MCRSYKNALFIKVSIQALRVVFHLNLYNSLLLQYRTCLPDPLLSYSAVRVTRESALLVPHRSDGAAAGTDKTNDTLHFTYH